jgi:hypothetical protein
VRSRLTLLAAPGAYLSALVLIWLSYASYSSQFTPVGRWSADANDPADYRFIAEYFWGVPFHPNTYDSIWHGGWGDYLRLIPFRSIGLGSFYLAAGWLRLGHAPATPEEVLAAGIALAYAQKVMLAIALLVLFGVVRQRWNTVLALFAVVATAFPPVYWRTSDDFLTEPPTRIFFLLAFACAIVLSGPRRSDDTPRSTIPAFLLLGLWLVATHLKVQWYVGALMLLPALVFETSRANLISKCAVALGAAALAVPLSVMAVNWIGWRTTTLSPGFGLHANLRYEGDVLREYSAIMATAPSRPAFADPDRPRLRWWNIYVGPEVTRAEWEAFDSFGRQYLRQRSSSALSNFWTGLRLASTVPAVQRITQGRIRLEPLEPPWAALVRWLDVGIWILLLVGLAFSETRLPCALALVLWIVPAIGNIVSPYEPRYHLPMSGIAAVAAAFVVVTLLEPVARLRTGPGGVGSRRLAPGR